MAQVLADRKDVDFILHDQLKVGTLSEHDAFAEFNKKTIDHKKFKIEIVEINRIQELAKHLFG